MMKDLSIDSELFSDFREAFDAVLRQTITDMAAKDVDASQDEGPRRLRRFRIDSYRLRTVRPLLLHDGDRPSLLRCHYRTLGEVHRQ